MNGGGHRRILCRPSRPLYRVRRRMVRSAKSSFHCTRLVKVGKDANRIGVPVL